MAHVLSGQRLGPRRSPGGRMPRGGALRPRALTFSLCSALRNETVLHQFCCPAADAEQKPACSDLGPHRWEEPLRVLPSPLTVLHPEQSTHQGPTLLPPP